MAGGLLNLVADGKNNVFLMGNPTKTYFRTTYAKHTNFGLQKFRIDYDGLRDLRLTEPSVFSFKIPRYADLLMDTYIVISLPDIWSPIYHPCAQTKYRWAPYEFKWIKDLGTTMVTSVELTCGNLSLGKFSGDYLKNMVERDFSVTKKNLFDRMSGNVDSLHSPMGVHGRANTYPSTYYTTDPLGAEPSIRGRHIYIPVNLWFTLNSTMAFPLVALQYNELHITVTLRPIRELFQVRDVFDVENLFPFISPDFTRQEFQMYRFLQTPPSENIDAAAYGNKTTTWNADIHLLATYCFLSENEARTFTSRPLSYLVRDVAQYNFENISGTQRMELTNTGGMVSSWMIFLRRSDVNLRNEWSNYTNWPYSNMPSDVRYAPSTSTMFHSFVYVDPITDRPLLTGPRYDLSGNATNIFTTGTFTAANNRQIMMSMAVLLDGSYREDRMESGVYEYVEKYTRSAGDAPDGVYCYNFCLNTNPFSIQPSGAINMSKFKKVELEITTYVPQMDVLGSQYSVACDNNGNLLGIRKQNWRLFEYTFTCTVIEEKYNILYFENGTCGLVYAR